MSTTSDPVTAGSAARPWTRTARRLGERAGRDALYLVVGGATGTAIFSIGVTLVSLSAGLMVLVVGVPVAIVSLEIVRWCAELERRRALLVDPEPVRGAYAPVPTGEGLVPQGRAILTDRRRWTDALYSVLQFPVTLAGFCVAVIAWSTAAACLTAPIWFWALGEDSADVVIGTTAIDAFPLALAACALSIALIPIAYWLTRGATIVNVGLVRLLLGDDQERMRARVSHLEETRAGAVDAATTELKRIERDLHDGAQARMVAVAMDLGMAEERMERDPEGARELVRGARDEARRALGEMRDLVRGIAPAVLADRGLDAALSALATRSPVPVDLVVELDARPPMSVETAAYFVVSEALVNAAKHAGATRCRVTVRGTREVLQLRIADDGTTGGAHLQAGGGLTGLRDRVAALDGLLEVDSPAGGPTVIHATIPCAS